MKLSEILGWKEPECTCNLTYCECVFTTITSYDREIDREELANIIKEGIIRSDITLSDLIISTMPTWLKPTERK